MPKLFASFTVDYVNEDFEALRFCSLSLAPGNRSSPRGLCIKMAILSIDW